MKIVLDIFLGFQIVPAILTGGGGGRAENFSHEFLFTLK